MEEREVLHGWDTWLEWLDLSLRKAMEVHLVNRRRRVTAHEGGCGGGLCPNCLTTFLPKMGNKIRADSIHCCQFTASNDNISIVLFDCVGQKADNECSVLTPAILAFARCFRVHAKCPRYVQMSKDKYPKSK